MSSEVVSASTLLAKAASATPAIQYKALDLQYDLGILAAFDAQPIDAAQFERDPEALLHRLTTERTQLLIKHIFELPVTMEDAGPVASLPPRSTKLPNARPPPKARPLTRWQKFALEKGIKKTKRSQKVWDETADDWKARHGYNVSYAGVVVLECALVIDLNCFALRRYLCAACRRRRHARLGRARQVWL